MKRPLLLLFLIVCSCLLYAFQAESRFNCSTLIIGRDASASGCVIVAHNEDDGGNQIINFYKIPGKDNRKGEVIKFKEGGVESLGPH